MVKRLCALLLLVVLALPCAVLMRAPGEQVPRPSVNGILSGLYAQELETVFQSNFPLNQWFSNLAWNLRYRTGTKEIDGYFITGQGSIVKNVEEPEQWTVDRNREAIRAFAERADAPQTYLLLLPTACAIKQQDLPEFAESVIYSQRDFIEQSYRDVADNLITVNAYPVLFANQDQYLYYNTEDQLTPLGGFHVYTALAQKLGFKAYSLNQFNVEYAAHDYLGQLSQKFPYAAVSPDLLMLYHFSNRHYNQVFMRNYKLLHENEGELTPCADLYDRSRLTSDQRLDVYFGGLSQVITFDITGNTSAKPSESRLLLIGDENARAYLPFLTPHYGEIVFLNAMTATADQFATAKAASFDQVLFAFSTDNYMHGGNLRVIEKL